MEHCRGIKKEHKILKIEKMIEKKTEPMECEVEADAAGTGNSSKSFIANHPEATVSTRPATKCIDLSKPVGSHDCAHLKAVSRSNKNPYASLRNRKNDVPNSCWLCNHKSNLSMCICCGRIFCGSLANNHVHEHLQTGNGTRHIIMIDVVTLTIYCHVCKSVVLLQDNQRVIRRILEKLRNNCAVKNDKTLADDIRVTVAKTEIDQKIEAQKKWFKEHKLEKASEFKFGAKKVSNIAKEILPKCNHKARGIENLGSTCYINAILQALRCVYLLTQRFRDMRSLSDLTNQFEQIELTENFRQTVIMLSNLSDGGKAVITPSSLILVIKKNFSPSRRFRQNDAHELLCHLISRMQDEMESLKPRNLQLNLFKGYNHSNASSSDSLSVLDKLFCGDFHSEVTCLTCGNKSVKHDSFYSVSLNIDDEQLLIGNGSANLSLYDALTKFTSVEHLSHTDLYNCTVCKAKMPSTKRLRLRRLPDVLCFHIKRFKWTNRYHDKIQDHIDFPLSDLDVSPYVVQSLHGTRHVNSHNTRYDLMSTITHVGRHMSDGHYISYGDCGDRCWHMFDDKKVNQVSAATVAASQAYILIYCRKTCD